MRRTFSGPARCLAILQVSSLCTGAVAAAAPSPSGKLLVVGASGGTGSRALRGLLDVGYQAQQLRVLTRDPSKASLAAHRNLGFELYAADLDDPETLRGVADGCNGCYVHSTAGDTKKLDTGEVPRAQRTTPPLQVAAER